MLTDNTSRISVVWVTLVTLTVGSFALGSSHGLPGLGDQAVGIIIFVIAMFKARLVGLYFMELRTAPTLLRGLFEAFCVALLSLLVMFFLI